MSYSAVVCALSGSSCWELDTAPPLPHQTAGAVPVHCISASPNSWSNTSNLHYCLTKQLEQLKCLALLSHQTVGAAQVPCIIVSPPPHQTAGAPQVACIIASPNNWSSTNILHYCITPQLDQHKYLALLPHPTAGAVPGPCIIALPHSWSSINNNIPQLSPSTKDW